MSVGLSSVLPFLLLLQPVPRPAEKAPLPYRWAMVRMPLESDAIVEKIRGGFRTMAGAYYDADDLSNPRDWLESLDATPGAVGILYATWLDKYELLGAFGDLVSGRK